MKKNSYILLLLALVILIGGAVWWLLPGEQNPQSVESSIIVSSDTQSPQLTLEQQALVHEAVTELKQAKKKDDDKGVFSATQKFAQAVGGKAGAMLGMAASRVVPVHFYGRVIDQNGQGVAGARVKMVIGGGGSMAPGTGKTFFETDAEGYFEVKAKGQGVSIIDVKHPRLADVYYRDRSGKKKQGKHLEATNQYGKKYNWHSYEKKEHPLEIHVWRVGKFEKVKKVRGGFGFAPVPNGKPHTVQGITVYCEREPLEGTGHWSEQQGSWSITLKPKNGGIQETDDLYLNKAPDSGYQPEITVSMARSDPDYKNRIYPARHYYYYINSGKTYGSIEAVFEPFMFKDECRVEVETKYNRSGSRNLAVRTKR